MKVDGACVLLTGASSGIGAALAPLLAEAGARVALVARREDRLLEVLEQCQPHAPGSQIWVCDLDDPGAAEECALEVEGAFGAVDVLVNNAAIPKRRRVTDLTVAEFQQTMRVNFESPVRMTLALLPGMLERGPGHHRQRVEPGRPARHHPRGGLLRGQVRAVRLERGDGPRPVGHGVEVRLIQPGPIDTEIWDQPDNDAAALRRPARAARRSWPRASSPPSRATPSSTTCPTSRASSSSRPATSTPSSAGSARGHAPEGGRRVKALVFGVTPEDVARAAGRRAPPAAEPGHHADGAAGRRRAEAVRARLDRAAHAPDRHLRVGRQAGR